MSFRIDAAKLTAAFLAHSATSPPIPMQELMSPPRRILIVDDDVDVANILCDLLTLFDYQVTVCCDGASAVAAATACEPDVAFVDIGMPYVDGFQVVAGLRRHPKTRDVRVVAHSAWGDAVTVAKAIAAGFDEHTTKPIRLERLLELAGAQYWVDKPVVGWGALPRLASTELAGLSD